MKLIKLIITSITTVSLLFFGCTDNTNAPTTVSVSQNLDIAVSKAEEEDGLIISVPPTLIEETVHVSELVHYPADEDMITVPFHFSDTTKYAAITEANLEKRIAVSVNGKVIYTPVVKARLSNGACMLLLTKEQVKQFFPDVDMNLLFSKN